jgi:hypothetical protein
MKNFVLAVLTMFSSAVFCQVSEVKDQEVINRPLYTTEEGQAMFDQFKSQVDVIGLTPEVKEVYLNIITSNLIKMNQINKGKNNTQRKLKQRLKVILDDQRKELKKIMTNPQFKRHQQIYKPMIMSIVHRIDSFE